MFAILINDILPVFAVLVLGFILGKTNVVSHSEATTLNRVDFILLQPPLIFLLLSQVNLDTLQYLAIFSYGLGQALIFTMTYLLCRHVLRHDVLESWLLGMTTIFVNSLLYIWPISALIYGPTGNVPIVAIVAWDASITFAFFVISTDILSHKSANLSKTLKRLIKNPVLLCIVFAVLFNLSELPLIGPVKTALEFLSAGTAAITLFALGVILSAHSLAPRKTICLVSAIKLFGLPALVALLMLWGEWSTHWSQLLILNAAGPSGAMAFAIAMLYGVNIARIAPVIIWTSLISVLTLAWLA